MPGPASAGVTSTRESFNPCSPPSPFASVCPSGLAPLPLTGTVSGAVRLNFNGAASGVSTIDVTLNLVPTGSSVSPFGSIDTPTDFRTGVTGAIPVTGWALDDIEVTRVMICRSAVGPEVRIAAGPRRSLSDLRHSSTGRGRMWPQRSRCLR